MRDLPESPVDVDRHHFIILNEDLETSGRVWLYRDKDWGDGDEIDDYDESEQWVRRDGVTSCQCEATKTTLILGPMQSGDWEERVGETVPEHMNDDLNRWTCG